MIEGADLHRLPIGEVMAGEAVGAEPAVVPILMAGRASARCSEESLVQIELDRRTFGRRDVGFAMTLLASKPGVFPFQGIPGLTVVEALEIPLDQGKILAVMFGVAGHALPT